MARVLVVDDAQIMRRNLKTILTQAGHSIVGEASNGMQACIEYARVKPDVVTMDLSMPNMDGLKAIERLIEKYPEALIIVISALDHKEIVYDAIKKGAKHYIVKPVTVDKVCEVLDKVINMAKSE